MCAPAQQELGHKCSASGSSEKGAPIPSVWLVFHANSCVGGPNAEDHEQFVRAASVPMDRVTAGQRCKVMRKAGPHREPRANTYHCRSHLPLRTCAFFLIRHRETSQNDTLSLKTSAGFSPRNSRPSSCWQSRHGVSQPGPARGARPLRHQDPWCLLR